MTQRNKSTLTALFQTGDVPTGTDYADFIDSYVNVVETTVQTMAGPLSTTELITARVSATNIVFGGATFLAALTGSMTVSAGGAYLIAAAGNYNVSAGGSHNLTTSGNIVINGGNNITSNNPGAYTISAGGNINLNGQVVASALRVTTDISANSGTVFASAFRGGVAVISAAGTTQGTAAVLTATVNRGKGVADGATTGFTPPANRAGLVQYLYNEGASANLWPPVGGTINGLAANAAYPLAASAMVTIVHLTASAMAAG